MPTRKKRSQGSRSNETNKRIAMTSEKKGRKKKKKHSKQKKILWQYDQSINFLTLLFLNGSPLAYVSP
jgi:hypothetical protein